MKIPARFPDQGPPQRVSLLRSKSCRWREGHAVPRGPEGLPVFFRWRHVGVDDSMMPFIGGSESFVCFPARGDEERDEKLNGAVS